MTAMTTMPTTGRCDVWRDCYGTDSNGTGKGDENFAQLHGISSSEHRVRRLMLFLVAYMGLNREPLSRAQGICAEAPKVSYNVVVAVHESACRIAAGANVRTRSERSGHAKSVGSGLI